MQGKFTKNTKYYSGIVYEWNLPTGHTCPFADECLVKVDRHTGKFENKSNAYRCYAASAERFPSARNSRWNNFDLVKSGQKPLLPKDAKAIRIHASGDFFNQSYFDLWIDIANENPDVEFWAYTKSLKYWVQRLEVIPSNFELTESYGGRNDELISQHDLKFVKIYKSKKDVHDGIPIDTNDDCARNKIIREFALIDNYTKE